MNPSVRSRLARIEKAIEAREDDRKEIEIIFWQDGEPKETALKRIDPARRKAIWIVRRR